MSRWVKQSGSFVRLDNAAPVGVWPTPSRLTRTSSTDATRLYTSVTTNASANTKGNWVELVSAAPAGVGMVRLFCLDTGASGGNGNALVDLGVGAAGAESVAVANIAIGYSQNLPQPAVIDIPLAVAEGARIAVRWQSARASATAARIAVELYQLPGVDAPGSVDTIGADTATSGGVSLGSTNGAWVQITASTSRAYRGVVLCPTSSDSGMSAGYVGFDLGVGGAGAEVAHLGSVTYQTTSIEELRPATGGSTFIPADIPSGSRLAVRVIDSLIVNNTGYSAVLIGVP